MAVEKEELLSKLKEWGVDFETERPKNFDIFQDKKGRLQSRRNGTAWIHFSVSKSLISGSATAAIPIIIGKTRKELVTIARRVISLTLFLSC